MQSSFNIASYLENQTILRPSQRAVVFPQAKDSQGRTAWTHLTFEELNTTANRYAEGLVRLGAQRGDRVSLLSKPSLDFIALVFAIFKLGALPVLIDPGMGRKNFLACLQRMKPKILIATPVVQMLKGFFPKAFASIEISITTSNNTGYWGGASLNTLQNNTTGDFKAIETQKKDEAAILFTSGSTGPAKGVTYTHGIFDSQTQFIQKMYDIQPGEIDLACFPLFGLFSVALGMTVVIPDLNPVKPAQANPEKLVSAIHNQGCTSAFGSPSIWKNVAKYCLEHKIKLPTLKRILMAGAPVPVSLHRAFTNILVEDAQIHTPYGATESLPVSSITTKEVLNETAEATLTGKGTCVGHPAPGITIRIIDIDDSPIDNWSDVKQLPPGQIGEICVRGEVVTHEYKEQIEATHASKITEKVGNKTHTIHRMGDLGYIDDLGRLWFCGRKKHRVQTEQGLMYTVPCEAIFNQHPEVFRSALVGVGKTPIIIIQRIPKSNTPKKELTKQLLELAQKHLHTRPIKQVLYKSRFPVDVRHNAKIRREDLTVWAQGKTK